MPYCPACGSVADPTESDCETCGEALRSDGERRAADPVEDEYVDGSVGLPGRALRVPTFALRYAFRSGAEPVLFVGLLGAACAVVALFGALIVAVGLLAFDATYGVLVLPAGVALVPVLLGVGYAADLTAAAAAGRGTPPEFDDYYDTAVEGGVALLALIPWAFVSGLAVLAADAIAGPLAVAVAVLALYPLPAVWTAYATGDVRSAYDPRSLAPTLASKQYVLGAVTFLPLAFVLGFFSMAASLFVVTIPAVAAFALYVAAAHWGAVAYLRSAPGDGEESERPKPSAVQDRPEDPGSTVPEEAPAERPDPGGDPADGSDTDPDAGSGPDSGDSSDPDAGDDRGWREAAATESRETTD